MAGDSALKLVRLSVQLLCGSLFIAYPASAEMYCGKENCYELLGVTSDVDAAAIKKAYRRLSLKWHPDKNPESKEEATKMFHKIAQAYEVLSNEEMRSSYDYSLRHPEEAVYNKYRYYKTRLGQKIPLQYVIAGLIGFVSVLQYVNRVTLCKQYRSSIQKTNLFKRQMQDATERRLEELGRKRSSKLSRQEEAELLEEMLHNTEVDGVKLTHFQFSDLLVVKLLRLPLTFADYVRRAPERRAVRLAREEEEREERLREEAALLEQQNREAEAAQRRLAAKDRKRQESLEVEEAHERQRLERQQEEAERKREAEERLQAGRRAHSYISDFGSSPGLAAEDLRPVLALPREQLLDLEKELRALKSMNAQQELLRTRGAQLREAVARDRAEMEKIALTPWHADEEGALAKGMQRFPGGTANRWNKICDFMEQSTGKARRTEQDVADKARSIASMGSRCTGPSETKASTGVPEVWAQGLAQAEVKAPPPAAVSTKANSPSDDDWSQAQQQALETALAKFPASLGLAANDRWDRIASCVEDKTRKQCLARYKQLREKLQSAPQ